jgi:putative acetyltransferase
MERHREAAGSPASVAIVPFTESHAREVLEVIGSVFTEYGMTFEPDGFDKDLRAIGDHYFARGGWFAVMVEEHRVVGTVGALPQADGVCEVKRLYLRPEYRGRGLGAALMSYITTWAAQAGFERLVAWSDARLAAAHLMYERLGFERFGERVLEDPDRSREYGFRKPIVACRAPGDRLR